jgi:hypothetical protein
MPWKVTKKSSSGGFQLLIWGISLTGVLLLGGCGAPAPAGITISSAPTTSPTSSLPLPPPEPTPVEAPPVEPPPVEPPPVEPPARSGCDESYPSVCIPPAPPDLDCGDIPHGSFQVLPPDPHGFDGKDNDGIGCESN